MRDRAFIFDMCIPWDETFYIIPVTFDLVTLTSNFESHTLNVAIHIWLPLGELRCLLTTLVLTSEGLILHKSKWLHCFIMKLCQVPAKNMEFRSDCYVQCIDMGWISQCFWRKYICKNYGYGRLIEYSRILIWPRSVFNIKCLMLIFIWYAYKFKQCMNIGYHSNL